MPYACKICIAKNGLKASDLDKLPKTEEELFEHLRIEHGIIATIKHQFCDHCPECRPVLVDLTTKEPLPEDSTIMRRVNEIWNNHTTYEERKAFINVSYHNSREMEEVKLATSVVDRIQESIEFP